MLKFVVAYLATAIVFFGLDFLWLSRMLGFYQSQLGGLLLDKPRLGYAGAFYAVYVIGVLVLVVLPAATAGSWVNALLGGALLGLVAYGTYDMTNMATLKGWSLQVALVDVAWGTVVTMLAATAGTLVLGLFRLQS
ncbi:MAG TPA: DUF2177 family protein [Devosia sp.]|jgi:uncharacterized membrane protein|nr:DUF2177 family protein [Devosia sp.]